MNEVMQRILTLMEEQHKPAMLMCRSIGLKQSTFSGWKMNDRRPQSEWIEPIAKFLGVSAEYILTGNTGNVERVRLENEPCVIKVLGRVAAGIPIEASEDVIGEEMITQKMAESGEYFGLRISGNSMEPEIHHGSIVIVRQQDDVENGDIAIVLINGGEATCKKIEKFDNGIMLVPFNKEYPEKFYTNEEIENLPVRILGKVVEQRKKY